MTSNNNGNGYRKFTPLRCPLCGGELIYSDGTHDLICERNTLDNGSAISFSYTSCGQKRPGAADLDPPRGKSCIFAISFTESVHSGTLFSIRVDGKVRYDALADVMGRILNRRGQLARNPVNGAIRREQRPIEKPADERLAEKHGLETEDVYSIKNSTETVKNLAHYYGITETDVRSIKKTVLLGTPDSL